MDEISENRLFDEGDIFDASDKDLNEILKKISKKGPGGEIVHREIIRALVINTIKSQRHINRIENRNLLYTIIIIALAAASIIMDYIAINMK
jgi:hypothetical protein